LSDRAPGNVRHEHDRCPICGSASKPWGDVDGVPILRCRENRCGFRFFDLAQWRPVYAGRDYYEDWTPGALNPSAPWIRARVDIVRRFKQQGSVAELGSGIGETAVALSEAGFSVVGVEGSEKATNYLAKRYPAVSWRNESIPGFLAKCGGSFDAITMFHVLEHLPQPQQVIHQVAAALRPNGVVVIEVPDAGGGLARLHGRRWDYFINHHVNYFDRRSLQQLMTSFGFHCGFVQRTYHFSFPQGNLAKDVIKGALAVCGLNSIIRTAWTR
jgi:SAM-dependent methyltransferase